MGMCVNRKNPMNPRGKNFRIATEETRGFSGHRFLFVSNDKTWCACFLVLVSAHWWSSFDDDENGSGEGFLILITFSLVEA